MFDILCFHQEEERKNKKIKKNQGILYNESKTLPYTNDWQRFPSSGQCKVYAA